VRLAEPSIQFVRVPVFRIPKLPTFRVPGLRKRSLFAWAAIIFLVSYLLVCCALFFIFVQPSSGGVPTWRVGADSATYFGIADALSSHASGSGSIALLSFGGNLLGPVLLAMVLKTAFWIALFNFTVFVIAIWASSLIPNVNPWLFAILLSINAETAVSLITLNKEIFALVALVLFAYYVYSTKRSTLLLALILVISLFARWEQDAIIVIFLFFARKKSFYAARPKLSLLLVTLGLSIAYPIALHSTNVDLTGFTSQAEGGNTIVVLNTLQAHYAYFLAVVPKVLMSLLGRLASPSYFASQYWSEDFRDLQNQFAIHLHELATLGVCIAVIATRKFRLLNPIPYFVALYLIVTAINPFIQPRYEYPVYVLLSLELARKNIVPATRKPVIDVPSNGFSQVGHEA
jgi:hypothetical protein